MPGDAAYRARLLFPGRPLCTSGKRPLTEQEAGAAPARRARERAQRPTGSTTERGEAEPYACRACGWWHTAGAVSSKGGRRTGDRQMRGRREWHGKSRSR